MGSEYGPEFDAFAKDAKENLEPMIKECNSFLAIAPIGPDGVDIKFAVEIGIALMLDKPIVCLIRPGTQIPEKLSRITDRFIEYIPGNKESEDNAREAIGEAVREFGRK